LKKQGKKKLSRVVEKVTFWGGARNYRGVSKVLGGGHVKMRDQDRDPA